MSYQFDVVRNMSGDLCAETFVPIGDSGRVLRISTHKNSRGLITAAYAGIESCGGRMFSYAPFSDFSRTVHHGQSSRCTEKNIRTMHAAGLAQVAELLQAAAAHYNAAAQFAAVPA